MRELLLEEELRFTEEEPVLRRTTSSLSTRLLPEERTELLEGRLEEPVTTRTEELLLARFDETLVRDEPAVARPSTRPV